MNTMPYTPTYHRRSIRLKGYDYSQAGLYLITICCQNHICRFGTIENGEMVLNDVGQMIEKWCAELSNKFSDIELDTYIIMPNHYHAIIVNNGLGAVVGADLRVCPDENMRVCPDENILGAHTGAPLHAVVQWFKTMTTNEYIRGVKNLGWQRFDKKLWQRNYWEHIIRNEQSYQYIAYYIVNNPTSWEKDKFYKE